MADVVSFELAPHNVSPGNGEGRVLLDLPLGKFFLEQSHTSICTYSRAKPFYVSCSYH